ncbi:olfactory receptor 52Z1-like [Protopterus annectens]|uniref:olfactory receptor 52Z1-like n=1 Tax=Protopterus annectens TaxID=7888 RepID=UPI001CFB1FC9|nr:olfactory receptor 52Z1-like [Protopterus annectens]
MDNSSTVFIINIRVGIADLENLSGLCAVCSVILYMFTVLINILVFSVIVLKSLHQPMHLFFSNLLFNGIIVSSALLPKLAADILSENRSMAPLSCYFQMFFIQLFFFTEQIALCIMAYDRYIAICNPLRYSQIMTDVKVCKLIICSWVLSIFASVIGIILCAGQPVCYFVIEKPYCDYYSFVKLLCSNYSVYYYCSSVVTVITTAVPMTIILYSYIRIIQICLQKSKDYRWKAFQTCFTHLLVFAIYVTGVLFTFIQNRLPIKSIPQGLHVFLSLEWLIVPPLANPLIYGLRTKQIRTAIVEIINSKAFTEKFPNCIKIRGKQQFCRKSRFCTSLKNINNSQLKEATDRNGRAK